jgi:Ni/Co efflux regulator RcnB
MPSVNHVLNFSQENTMRTSPLISTFMAITLLAAGTAFAQPRGNRDDNRRYDDHRNNYQQRRDNGLHRGQQQRPDERGMDRRNEWGAGENHQYHRGERLPSQYRERIYVVNDWRGHNLRAPPRGHHWVQMGGDYVLVAITTGIIVELMLNH